MTERKNFGRKSILQGLRIHLSHVFPRIVCVYVFRRKMSGENDRDARSEPFTRSADARNLRQFIVILVPDIRAYPRKAPEKWSTEMFMLILIKSLAKLSSVREFILA